MIVRETKVPAIPDVREDNVLDVLRAVKNVLEVREGNRGDTLDQNVTLRDLKDLSLVKDGLTTLTGGSAVPVAPIVIEDDGYNPSSDFTPPPTPTGLTATGGFTNVFLSWTGAQYRNHAYTEIWRATTNNLGSAARVGTTISNVYSDAAAPDTTYYYWVRFVSVADVIGAYNDTNGTSATTAIDVSSAYDEIFSNTVASSNTSAAVPFLFLAAPTTFNGKTYPAGTWIKDTYIANATISSAKIESLVADKITAGNLTAAVGITTGYLSGGITPGVLYPPGHSLFGTGFYLGPWGGTQQFYIGSPTKYLLWDGTDLTIKGIIYASGGQIGTNIIDSTGISSSNYVANSAGWKLFNNGNTDFNNVALRGQITAGASTGYAYNPNGQWGMYLGPSGFLIGNSFSGKYFSVDGNGNVYAPGFSIVNGTGTFSGNVSANTLSTNSGRFTAYADGTVVADLVDIRRRAVIETGSLDPTEIVLGGYDDGFGGYISYPAGTVFVGEIKQLVATNTYDSNTQSTSANQPYYVASYFTGSAFRSYSGGTTTFELKLTGSVAPVRTYSNSGVGTNDFRLYVYFRYEIKLVSGSFTSFRLPTASWTLYKL